MIHDHMRLTILCFASHCYYCSCYCACYCYCYCCTAVIICDQEYPVRPAFSLLSKLLDDFTSKVPQSSYSNPGSISFPDTQNYLQKYQDPTQADTIMRVQQELDETKIVLVSIHPSMYPYIHSSIQVPCALLALITPIIRQRR